MIPDCESGSFPRIREYMRWGMHMLPRLDPDIIRYPINKFNEYRQPFLPEKRKKAERDHAGKIFGEKQKNRAADGSAKSG